MIATQEQNHCFSSKKHSRNVKTQDTITSQDNLQISLIHVDNVNKVPNKNEFVKSQLGNQMTTPKKKFSIIDPTKLLQFKTNKNMKIISPKHENTQDNLESTINNFNVKCITHSKMAKTKKFKTQYITSSQKVMHYQLNNYSAHQKLKTISHTSPINFTRLITSKTEYKNKNKINIGQIDLNRQPIKQKMSCIQTSVQQNYQQETQLDSNKFDEQMKRRMNYESKKARYRIKIPQLLVFKKKKLKQDKIYLSHKLQQSTNQFKLNQEIKQDLDKMNKLFKKRAASVQLCFLY